MPVKTTPGLLNEWQTAAAGAAKTRLSKPVNKYVCGLRLAPAFLIEFHLPFSVLLTKQKKVV